MAKYDRIIYRWQVGQRSARFFLKCGKVCVCCKNRLQHECQQRGLKYTDDEFRFVIHVSPMSAQKINGIARDLDLAYGSYDIYTVTSQVITSNQIAGYATLLSKNGYEVSST